ncbi:Lar family restriction alleviation protein [Adlercreutzia equolifaciens]|uniref:Lar family restriction alleviation protein n=1 Tax=Adlercreutzia equolifaciens TaxID=446660 RepID=UPI0003897AA8|nr:Lar family restriction alleviation protein [Adlercreutzia equolifaciens]RFT84694.1 hypothetical protein DX903_05775 [Adlercreutzia equolifaciens]BAN77156.1 hypothetical protein AEQU_1187 [Adlercreutzia equolifaciens DSM 19450]
MSDELKPCPLCGGPVLIHRRTDGQVDGIVCDECLLTLEAVDVCPEWHTLDELVLRWNARAAVTDEQFAQAVHDGETWQKVRECCIDGVSGGGNCGTTTYRLSCGHVAVMPMGARFAYCPNCGAKVVAE